MVMFVFCLAKKAAFKYSNKISSLQEYIRKRTAVNREPATDIQGPHVDEGQCSICCEWVREFGKQELV